MTVCANCNTRISAHCSIHVVPCCPGKCPGQTVYVYRWGNNPRRRELKGRSCRVLARGTMNTVLVQFIDTGEKVTTSHRALAYKPFVIDVDRQFIIEGLGDEEPA